MKKLIIVMAILGLIINQSNAQSDVDALRYSLTPILGSTARSLGLGGSAGAVGADPSAALSNPAGLAQYKTGIFNFSLGTLSLTNKATYLNGSPKVANNFLPEFSSVNLIFTDRKLKRGNPATTGWVNTNFQLGYNRLASYNRNISYKGVNNSSSYTDFVADYVRGVNSSTLDPNQEQEDYGFYYYENMFWYAYLIDSFNNGNYYANYDPLVGGINQSSQISTKGGMGQYNASFAANYEHKLYLGASLNVNQINYTEKNVFSETDNPLSQTNWTSFDFTRNLQTTGYGIGGTLGLIFRPNDNIRIGGTMHTPTKMMLKDAYSDELYVRQDNGEIIDIKTVDKQFSYTVTSPAKYGVQAAYIFGKKGLLTGELESVNYSTMNIASDGASFDDTNDEIANKYKNTINLKVGGEYVINAFRLRGGYAMMGNPIAQGAEYSRNIISGGFGIQEANWAIDLGVSRDITKDVLVPYNVPSIAPSVVSNQLRANRLMVTLTSKF